MNNVPKLRFPGFEGGWEKMKLGAVVYIDLKPIEKPTETYVRLRLRSHGKGTFYEKVDNPETIEMDTLYEVHEDQLLVNITFAWEHAICVTTKEDAGKIVSHRFPTYSFKEGNVPAFYKYYILQPRFKYHLGVASPGGAGRNRVLNKTAFLELLVPKPSSAEQTKIADFLTLIDKKITKQDEKITALEQYKKGLMHKIFSREIRFKDDNGKDYPEWQSTTLGEITLSITNGLVSNQEIGVTDYPVTRIETISDGIINLSKVGYVQGVIDIDKYKLEKGDILFSHINSVKQIGKTAYYDSNENLYHGMNLLRIKPNQNVCSFFVYKLLNKEDMRYYFKKICKQAVNQASLNQKDLENTQLVLPSLPEQTKIANFLSLYDRKIEKEKAKLEALQEQKKGLLQQMFV